MSYTHPIDTSPNHPTSSDAGRNQGDNGLGATAATPNTLLGIQRTPTQDSSAVVHHDGSSNNVSAAPSPSLDRSLRRSLPVESHEGSAPVQLSLDDFNQGTSEGFEGPSSSIGHASNHLQRLAGTHHQSFQNTSGNGTGPSVSRDGSSRGISPAGRLQKECEEQRKKQGDIQINDGPLRLPERADFPSALSMEIINPDQVFESCIILMHSLYNNEASLKSLVQILESKQPESAFILLRGLKPIEPGNSGYHWADSSDKMDEGFINTSRVILDDLIRDGLMAKCNLSPRDIVVIGHGQGGMAALAATACWNCIEFGGVVSLGGPMPAYVQLQPNIKAKTPTLIYGGARGDITRTALQQIQKTFSFADHYEPPSGDDRVPSSDEETAPLLDFLAHRLRREEWKRQAVISFDGGGIRGYGSLLILQELMNKIGDLEKLLDDTTESSFSPSDYKPTNVPPKNANSESANSLPPDPYEVSDAGAVGPTESHGLLNSALFLPCHYFNYAAGSSTGGLISIMLFRLRMTVDECIEEYKSLGEKVFGHPRRGARGGFPWPRFEARAFEKVIRDVTSRYDMQNDNFKSLYGMERTNEDMSQCVVLAYSNHAAAGEFPYLLRTYQTQEPPLDPDRTRIRQRFLRNLGDAAMSPIWEVARATSAAPGYFRPIKIKTRSGEITFKDGAFGSNNPSDEAYKDIRNKHGGIKNMGPFISIGTGTTPPPDMFGKGWWSNWNDVKANLKTALKLPARTFNAHDQMVDHAYPPNEETKFPYFRFDGGLMLGEVKLGEWKSHHLTRITGRDETLGIKTLKKIEVAVAVFLQNREVQKDLEECAKLLVERRRLQSRDSSRWDRYASYSHYECNMKGCQKPSFFNTAQDFKEHLLRFHKFRVADPVIEQSIKQCRRVKWIYPPKRAPESAAKDKGKRRA